MRNILLNLIEEESFQTRLKYELGLHHRGHFNPKNYAQVTIDYADSMQTLARHFDPVTYEHQHRVAKLVAAIAFNMKLEPYVIFGLILAASMHDIGKTSVYKNIVQKPEALTEDEFTMVREHTTIGFHILEKYKTPWKLEEIALSHHERLDGSGYPRGLVASEIDLKTRIVGACDVYDAIMQTRPYHVAGTHAEAMEILKDTSHFDQSVVEVIDSVAPTVYATKEIFFSSLVLQTHGIDSRLLEAEFGFTNTGPRSSVG